MNEEIEYAEMLEIPVSTVNVVRKSARKRKRESVEEAAPLKESVIEKVNDRVNELPIEESVLEVEPDLFAESVNSEGRLDFDPIPERIDTVRVYSTEETNGLFGERLYSHDYDLNHQNEGGMYETKLEKAIKIGLSAEFAAACVLCGAIFLTNVFMPNSAINTFFRAIASTPEAAQTDTRGYADFELAPVVSELADVELSLSPAGILTFTKAACVYPAANGTIAEVTRSEEGIYTVKIKYSDSFTGVMSGLSHVYYEVGDEVKAYVPMGYSGGEHEVQVTMYSSGELLNCFELTEENCIAWIENTEEK